MILENIVEKKTDYLEVLKDVDIYLDKIDSYKIQDNLYKLQGEELDVILASLGSCKIPNKVFTYKDILREKLVNRLELSTLDTVIFADNVLYIKRFFQVKSKEDRERRACGMSQEELDSYKNKYFEDESYKEIIKDLLIYVLEDSLNYRKLTPFDFKKSFISVFINIAEIVVIEYSQITDSKVIKGLSLSLLREVFDELMFYIAEDILFSFANQDKKATEFLNYFGLDEKIDSKGVRHKAIPILDDSNNAWNMTTIKSAMIQHKKAKELFYEKKSKLITMKKKLEEMNMEQIKTVNLKESKEVEFTSIETSLSSVRNTIDKLKETTSQKITYMENNEEKVHDKKPLMAKLFKKEDNLLSQKTIIKKVCEDLTIQISNRQKNIDIWIKKYYAEKDIVDSIEKKGHPADRLYNRIKKALAKTLAKR